MTVAPDGLEMPSWFDPIEEDPIVRKLLSIPVPVPGVLVRRAKSSAYRQLAFLPASSTQRAVVDAFGRDGETRADLAALLESGRGLAPELSTAPFDLVGIRCPVLLVWGSHDRMLPHTDARVALDSLPTTQVRVDRGRGPSPAARGHRPPARVAASFRDLSLTRKFACEPRRRGYLHPIMRRTVFATLAVLLALVPTAGAAEPRIAAGVSAAGIDVSGLTLAEAAGKLYESHGFTVGKPLSTHVAGRKFAVNPSDLGFVYDVNKSARRAYNAGIAPHTGPVDVPLFTTYDAKKVSAYAEKVASTIKKNPRDARVNIGLSKIGKVASKDGRTIDAAALATAVGAVLGDPKANRILTPKLKVVRPKVTTAGLAKAYGTIVTIDRGNFKLRLFKGLKLSKTYGVAVGMPAYPTPTGRYTIANKAVNPAWTAPELAVGRRLRQRDRPGRLGGEPAEGPLDGDRQRRGHPRHRCAGLDRQPRVARLHPHDRCRTWSICTPVSRSGRPCSSETDAHPSRRSG